MSARRRGAVSGAEWRWAIAWALLILGLASAPYLGVALQGTPALRFGGLV